MIKIGVVTLSNSTNFGGMLQAYALSEALKKSEMIPIMLRYQDPSLAWNSVLQYLRLRKKLYGVNVIRMAGGSVKTLCSNIHYHQKKSKIKRFDKFRSNYLLMTPYCLTMDGLIDMSNMFDGYITGSDQVWNAEFTDNQLDPVYLLEFVPPNKPCFSYAASVGGDKSTDYLMNLMTRIKRFEMISVREKSLADGLNRLGKKKVLCHVDPVFLLTKTDWQAVEKEPNRKIPEHYILVYYLEKATKGDSLIAKVIEKTHLPVIDISGTGILGDRRYIYDMAAGPQEFVYYLRHADYIVTNSFHAVAFSVLFQTKFIACSREGQESRVRDFLENIGLLDHLVADIRCDSLFNEIPDDIEVLSKRVNEAYQYLKDIHDCIESGSESEKSGK